MKQFICWLLGNLLWEHVSGAWKYYAVGAAVEFIALSTLGIIKELAWHQIAVLASGFTSATVCAVMFTAVKIKQLKMLRSGVVEAHPVLSFETYAHADIAHDRITIVGIKVMNTRFRRLRRCSVRLENIGESNAGNPGAVLSDSSLKETLPLEKFFALAARDSMEVPIAKFDAINSPFENLGIELLCFSTRKYPALDCTKTYILTIVGTAETGIPNKQNYKLWVEGNSFNQRLRLEEADDVFTL